MSKAQDSIDGYAVELYDGRFSGTFEMDEAHGKQVAFDDVVTFVVVAEVASPKFSQNKAGEVKRTNSFKVTNVKIVNGNTALEILNKADLEVPGITPPPAYHGSEAFIDPDSGEIYGADVDPTQPWWDDEEENETFEESIDNAMDELFPVESNPVEMTGTGTMLSATPGATSFGRVGQTNDASLRAFLESGV